ncbi:hypothetical protein TNCV_501521, partial [Trichonephila clavipes]
MLDEHSWSRTSGGVVSSHRVRGPLLFENPTCTGNG